MNDLPQTRQSLLLELGRQSDTAWTEFLQVYEDALYRFCRSRGLQDGDARDVVQDVLTAVMHRLPTWDADTARGSFRGWLFRVARNIAVDVVARRARDAARGGELAAVASVEAKDEATFELEYQRSLYDWAAQQVRAEVRDQTWQAFLQTAVQGEPAEQVAAALGVPVGSVYTAKCRVVARIRERIASVGEDFQPEDV